MNRKNIVIDKLKCTVIPVLRQNGFAGSFPHFRRIGENQIDLISVQFDKGGGGYRLCLSKCPSRDIKDLLKQDVEPGNTTAWHFGDRYASDWFRYDHAPDDNIQQYAEKLVSHSIVFLDVAQQYWEGKLVQRQSQWSLWKWKILDLFSFGRMYKQANRGAATAAPHESRPET